MRSPGDHRYAHAPHGPSAPHGQRGDRCRPLHGPRTGIGHAVAGLVGALSAVRAGGSTLKPYVTSTRAEREDSQRRLPLPAAAAIRMWSRNSPPLDRWLGRPDVVHGTNYVVPPSRCPRRSCPCTTAGSSSTRATSIADVRRAAAVLRRSRRRGHVRGHVVERHDGQGPRAARHRPGPHDPSRPPTDPDDPARRPTGQPARHRRRRRSSSPWARIERRKNLPTLVAAFGRLAHEHRDVRLVIAGADGQRPTATSTRRSAGSTRRPHRGS